VPAAASASSPHDYVVILTAPAGSGCAAAVAGVTDDYGVAPTSVYTSSTCGFAATLSKSSVRALTADERVAYVVADGQFGSN
jgi:hypothetical protein